MTSTRSALPDIIRTARLTLRAPSISDLADLVALANNWQVAEPTAVMPFPYSEADGRAFLATIGQADAPRAYAIANGEDRLMGVVSLKFAEGKPPELGYWLGQPHWGKGYVPEAAAGLLQAAAAAGIADIHARVLESNQASIRVLEKAGFTIIEHTHSVVERHRGKPLLIMAWSAP
jgi:RimJ/RimL family protein N-acetyltransferase